MPKTEGGAKAKSEQEDDAAFLPRSLFVPQQDPRADLRAVINSVLSDRFMAVLSILLIPIILLPFVTALPQSVLGFMDFCDWLIVFVFVVEYTSKLYLANGRWAHFKEPWHLVDLLIVVISFVQFVPFFGIATTGSPSLLVRLLRLPRALVVGGRALGGRLRVEETVSVEKPPELHTTIRGMEADLKTVHEGLTWDALRSHVSDPDQEWLDIHNISDEGFSRLSSILRIPEPHFKSESFDVIYPNIDYVERVSMIFVQSGRVMYPESPNNFLTISRSGIVMVCSGTKIITASRHGPDLVRMVMNSSSRRIEGGSFVVSVLYGILDLLLKEYRSIFSEIEVELVAISRTPRSRLPKDFLERIYQLKKEVAGLDSHLVHFSQLLSTIISRKVSLVGFDEKAESSFDLLEDDAEYLGEIVDSLSDNVQSMIDLYINQTSFETNRIIKILAVITAIAVIPATVSGMLGTNLLGLPYEVQLWQVVLMTAIVMSFAAYVFIKLGWLRT